MYSIVMLMAMSGAPEMPAWGGGRMGGCCGCNGGGYSSCGCGGGWGRGGGLFRGRGCGCGGGWGHGRGCGCCGNNNCGCCGYVANSCGCCGGMAMGGYYGGAMAMTSAPATTRDLAGASTGTWFAAWLSKARSIFFRNI